MDGADFWRVGWAAIGAVSRRLPAEEPAAA